MDIYDELGVRKIINGSATLTMLGGSLMPPEALAAMAQAAQHFVDIDELQDRVGKRSPSGRTMKPLTSLVGRLPGWC